MIALDKYGQLTIVLWIGCAAAVFLLARAVVVTKRFTRSRRQRSVVIRRRK